MKKSKLKVLGLELFIIFVLILLIIFQNKLSRWGITLVILFCSFISYRLLKNRKINSYHKKIVAILFFLFGLVYLAILYLMGLYFGFVRSKILFSLNTVFNLILPISIVIIISEILRSVLLSQDINFMINKKEKNFSPVLTFIILVLIDILMYTGSVDFNNLDSVLTMVGFVLFSSIANNLLFNFISVRYDYKGIIIFKLMINLYMYFIPIIPDVYMFMMSFFKMLFAYIIYIVIDKLFSKNDFVISYFDKRRLFVGNTILMMFAVFLIMLVSCQFKYGIMVIGSESMMGTLNKGDMVLFKSYNSDDEISEGQVIIFNYNNIKTVHRVVKILNVNGINRYYTKGDANKHADDGYITKEDIQGIVKFDIRYLGYPTLFLKEMFEN